LASGSLHHPVPETTGHRGAVLDHLETEPNRPATNSPQRLLADRSRRQKGAANPVNQLQHIRAYALWYVTAVASLDEATAYSMGRAGIEPATLGLKVEASLVARQAIEAEVA
jgi:hypothetical protein